MSRYQTQAPPQIVAECMAMVAPAEAAFRSRWRMTTLERVNRELHDRLAEQIDLYSTALISASTEELREQAGAMVRGWSAACREMEALPDDAYLTGLDWESRTRVVVSCSKQSISHVKHQDGVRTLTVTPDEIAKLLGRMGIVSLTKATFPNAEIVDFKPDEEAA